MRGTVMTQDVDKLDVDGFLDVPFESRAHSEPRLAVESA